MLAQSILCMVTCSTAAGDTDQDHQFERRQKTRSAFMPEVQHYRDSLRQMGIRTTRASLAKYLTSSGEYAPTLDEQAEFSRLAVELGDEDYTVRENASAKLLGLGHKFVVELEELARTSKDLEVRVRANGLLRQVNRSCTPVNAMYVIARDHITGLEQEILTRLDRDASQACCDAAEFALTKIAQDDGCRRMQLHISSTPHHHSRLVCVRALSRIATENSRNTFQSLSVDPSPEMRLAAGVGLARIGDTSAVRVLVDLLESDRLMIRHRAAVVLQRWQKQFFGFRAFADVDARSRARKEWQKYASRRNFVEIEYRPPKHIGHVLAVCSNTLFEFDADGNVVHQRADFDSLSEATAAENGHVFVTDWADQSVYEFDRNWEQLHKTSFSFQPRSAVRFPDGDMIISSNRKVYFLDRNRKPTRVAFFRRISSSPLRLPGKRLMIWSSDAGGVLEIPWKGGIGERILVTNGVPRSLDLLSDGRFLIADSRQVAIYEPNDPNLVWSLQHSGLRSATALASGNVLLGHETGLTIIDRDKQVVWRWEQPQLDGDGFYATEF